MKLCNDIINISSFSLACSSALALVMLGLPVTGVAAPKVIELTQVPCQFLESENGVNHRYKSTRKADCEMINAKTAPQRLAESKTIVLQPGEYIFRVTNKNVPYDLGFWLRGDGVVAFATLPSVSGGGLSMGKTRDYKINLKLGEYIYSCPLNPTPNYKLIVE
ncbi:MAG: hypothetical protein R3268_04725 [Acidiferrobacterales bacterium]|nr:hypothetical protein [Acidiferrobacterales bacterium]